VLILEVVTGINLKCSVRKMAFSTEFNVAVAEVCRRMELRPLKPKQLEALRAFISGKDTFVALPTEVYYFCCVTIAV